jgi:hypothetical protein
MFDVQTDHQIVAFGADTMGLFNAADGTPVATAVRAEGVWTIHADGIDDTTAANRPDAIDALKAHALALPGAKSGYSTTVPHDLREQP